MRICLWGMAIILTRTTARDWLDGAVLAALAVICIAADLREMKRQEQS